MTSPLADFLEILAIVLIASAVYIFLLNRLATAVRPYRLKLARKGGTLLRDPSLTTAERYQIELYLQHAYSALPIVVVAVSLPVVTLVVIFRSIVLGNQQPQNKASEIAGLFLLSSMAANPLFGFIVFCELVAVVLAVIILTGQIEMIRVIVSTLAWFESGKSPFKKLAHR